VKAFSPIVPRVPHRRGNDPDRSAHTHPHNSRPSKGKWLSKIDLHSEQLAGGEIEADNGTGYVQFRGNRDTVKVTGNSDGIRTAESSPHFRR